MRWHPPSRHQALQRMTAALKSGGWILIEVLDYASAVPVSQFGAREHHHTQQVRLRLMGKAGLDAEYGRLPAALQANGLVDVQSEGRVWVMQGGSPGVRRFRLSMEQLRGTLVGPGTLQQHEVDWMLALFEDPHSAALSLVVMAAWGRRPPSQPS